MKGFIGKVAWSTSLVVFVIWHGLAFSKNRTPEFLNLRQDQTVPARCTPSELSHFAISSLVTFTLSVDKSSEHGFNLSHPIHRDEASIIWKTLLHPEQYSGQFEEMARINPKMREYLQILKENSDSRDFHFDSEGEVLELLAIMQLQDLFDRQQKPYFVTGSLAYSYGENRIGELDVVIADRLSCLVVGIGEVKLGIRQSGKAHSQLFRFVNFLGQNQIHPDIKNPRTLFENNQTESFFIEVNNPVSPILQLKAL